MARAKTTSDIFNAVAEPKRRQILTLLKGGEQSVQGIADQLEMKQPQTSKHLRILKEVDLVSVRSVGKTRQYGLNAENLKPIYEWAGGFEEVWRQRTTQLESYLEHMKTEEENDDDF